MKARTIPPHHSGFRKTPQVSEVTELAGPQALAPKPIVFAGEEGNRLAGGMSSIRRSRGKIRGRPASIGFLLTDPSYHLIWANPEAIQILTYPGSRGNLGEAEERLAEKVPSLLKHEKRFSRSETFNQFTSGRRQYVCRIIYLRSRPGGTFPLNAALLLERKAPVRLDSVGLAERYSLTPRERGTVELLMQGLTSKEIASRMHISPNTVKTFLRLVMIKMGVSTRSGVVGKVVEELAKLSA